MDLRDRITKYKLVRGGCWDTTLARTKTYPCIKIDGRNVTLHRAAYECFVGPIPTGMCVLHRCDNPRCWRPAHLFIGTASDNMRDMVQKGRNRPAQPRIDPSTVIALQHLSQKEIAAQLGISQPHVSKILRTRKLSRGRQTTFGKGHGTGGWPKGTPRQYPHGPAKKDVK